VVFNDAGQMGPEQARASPSVVHWGSLRGPASAAFTPIGVSDRASSPITQAAAARRKSTRPVLPGYRNNDRLPRHDRRRPQVIHLTDLLHNPARIASRGYFLGDAPQGLPCLNNHDACLRAFSIRRGTGYLPCPDDHGDQGCDGCGERHEAPAPGQPHRTRIPRGRTCCPAISAYVRSPCGGPGSGRVRGTGGSDGSL